LRGSTAAGIISRNVMKVETAYALLNLHPDASREDLLRSYRRLVKKYHPDHNTDRAAWSHIMMTRLGHAYDTARAYIEAGGAAAHGGVKVRYRPPVWETQEEEEYSNPEFEAHFREGMDTVLNGMYIYYQYGLENVYLRQEGVRRFKYRAALKGVRNGIDALREGIRLARTGQESDNLQVVGEFSLTFLRNMQISRSYIPHASAAESRAYRHFSEGSAHLDHAIRSHLFSELETRSSRFSVSGSLKVGYHELMTVLVEYPSTSWVAEAIVKLYLHDLFQKAGTLL